MSERPIEDVNRRLGEIIDELAALGDDQFAERHLLQTERDQLRSLVRTTSDERDLDRSSDDIRTELGARNKELERLNKNLVSPGGMADTMNGTGSIGSADAQKLNSAMRQAFGMDALRQRIDHLEGILVARGDS